MAQQAEPMAYEDFASNPDRVFEQARDRNQPVLVERNGETYRLEREEFRDIWEWYDPAKVQQALTATRGLLAGADRETFLREMHEQREQGANRFR